MRMIFESSVAECGRLKAGTEALLEEMPRLPFFNKNAHKRENRWSQIISGCDLTDTI